MFLANIMFTTHFHTIESHFSQNELMCNLKYMIILLMWKECNEIVTLKFQFVSNVKI